MNKSILLLLVCLTGITICNAQRISGHVSQDNGAPQEFATVALYKASDSALVTGVVTGPDGNFEFRNIKQGNYYVQASMVGMEKNRSKAFSVTGKDIEVDKLTLKVSSQQLKQVEVVAKRPVLEIQADKTIMNVDGTINSTGLNALELLRKAPGINIDNDDNITVRGKNGVKFQIDGRDVPLDSKGLAQQLKGMQASEISNIEIITNPSAKYDASGNAGIINIRLKKNKAFGTNGNIGADFTQGVTPKGGINTRLNHRDKNYNVFGSYNNHYGIWHDEQHLDRYQSGKHFDQMAYTEYYSKWNSIRAGADWFINSRNTLGLLLNGSTNPFPWTSTSRTLIGPADVPLQKDSILVAGDEIKNKRYDYSLNLNYAFSDTNGRSFSLDLGRGAYDLQGNSYQPNYYYDPTEITLLRSFIYRSITPTLIGITTIKGDYEQKVFKGNFSAGFKFSDVKTDNTLDFYNVVDVQEIRDVTRSNRFRYEEQTNAAYVNYAGKFGKLNLQSGLRVENTHYTGELISGNLQNGAGINVNYTELFPSAALTYMLTQKNGLNITYSRRIDRPSYQDLNPFEYKLDELTYSKGNPNLRPQFTNSFELSPIVMGQPLVKLGFSRTTDLFTNILDTTNTNASFITQDNIATQDNYSIAINLPTPFSTWWDGMISFTGYRSVLDAQIRKDFSFHQSIESYNVYAEQNFLLKHGFSFQVSGWYNSKAMMGTLAMNPHGSLDIGVRRKFLNDRAEVGLRVGDILGTARWSGENMFTPGLVMKASGHWESRTLVFNFSYRFGSNEIKNFRQRSSGLEEETRRVKQAGG